MKFDELKATVKYLSILFSITIFMLIGFEYLFRAVYLIKRSNEGVNNRNVEKVLQDLIIAFDGKYSKEIISLPIGEHLNSKHIKYICQKIIKFFNV